MTILNDCSEENFFNNISNGEYDLLTEADYNVFLEIIEEVTKEKSCLDNLQILEAGCGTGMFGRKILTHLKSRQITVTGVDVSNNLIDYLKSIKLKNYIPIHGNILSKTLFESETFDIIICPFVLHHLLRDELKIFIKNSYKWLKPEGYIIIFEPNGSNPILRGSNIIGRMYRFFFRNTKYISPNERIYSCQFYDKLFMSSKFIKIAVKEIRIEGKLLQLGVGIKLFVTFKNHLSNFLGGNVISLIYKKAKEAKV